MLKEPRTCTKITLYPSLFLPHNISLILSFLLTFLPNNSLFLSLSLSLSLYLSFSIALEIYIHFSERLNSTSPFKMAVWYNHIIYAPTSQPMRALQIQAAWTNQSPGKGDFCAFLIMLWRSEGSKLGEMLMFFKKTTRI